MPPCATVYSPVGEPKARRERLSKRYDGLKKKIDALAILTGAKVNLRVLTTDGEATEYSTDGWDIQGFIDALKRSGSEPPWARQDRDSPTPKKKGKRSHSKHRHGRVRKENKAGSSAQEQPPPSSQMQGRPMGPSQAHVLDLRQHEVDPDLFEFEQAAQPSMTQTFSDFFSMPPDFGSEPVMYGTGQSIADHPFESYGDGSSYL